MDSSGSAYVTGFSSSSSFPTTAGALKTTNSSGVYNAFVTKFSASGSALVYSTYLGGTWTAQGTGIAVDSAGNAYITGEALSSDFPTTAGAFQTTYRGNADAFVAKLSANGSSLVYSTYFGGSQLEIARGIAVDSSDNAYITGTTFSPDFPTLGALQSTLRGSQNAFVAEFSGTGSLVYSTYLGGSGFDQGSGIAVDLSGNAYVTGYTSSSDFPTANAIQSTCRSCPNSNDAFVAEISTNGTGLAYSTYLGGSGEDQGRGIAVDALGSAYVAGATFSTNFPVTAGVYQTSLVGGSSAFVAKIAANGSALGYSTYLGANNYTIGQAVATLNDNVYVTGITQASLFPVVNATQSSLAGSPEAFVTELNSAGTALYYSTFLGGSGRDEATGIALDSLGNAYITGLTRSTNYPTVSAFDSTFGGDDADAFVTKIHVSPISLSTISLSYPSQAVGTTSTSQQVTVTNNGHLTLTISAVTFSGTNLGDFSQTNNCSSLSPAATCNVQVTFAPTAGGTRTATLSVASDPSGSPAQTVSLTGTATGGSTASTTTITGQTPNPSSVGQAVAVTFTVTGSGGTPTGNVTVSDGVGDSCTGTVAAGSCSLSFPTAGTKTLTANYGGDSNFSSSTSAGLTQTVTASTTTTITGQTPNPSSVGQAVAVTFTVTGSGGTPTGNVTVSDGVGDSCTGTVAAGSCSVSFPTAGTKTLTASYAGDSNFSSSISAGVTQTVNSGTASTTTITGQTPNPSVVGQAAAVTFTVTGSGGTPTGNVTVSDGVGDSCTGTVAAGSCSLSFATAGTKTLTASYAGDSIFNASTSIGVTQTVNKASTTTTISGQTPNPSAFGQAVTVSFAVAAVAPGSGTATGSVTVSDGVGDSCTGTVAAGSCSASFATAGAKTLSASYAGDSNFNASTSAGVTQTVNKANTTTTITAQTPNPSGPGQAVAVSFTVAAVAPGSGTATGNVTVSDGVGDTCTGTVAAGSCSVSFATVGAYTLTASYAGDSNFNASASAGVTQTVKASTTTTITGQTPNPSSVGQAVAVSFTVTSSGGTPTGNVTVSDGVGDTCTGTVAAGSCSLSFATGGTKTLTASYAGDTNFNASISAGVTQTVTVPAVTLSTTTLNFGKQTVSTTSPPKPVTLTNTGNGPLTITSIAITGINSGDFAQTNNCGGSVATGANCTINVTFTPAAKGGRAAALSITDNASGSPQQVSLKGSGK